MPLNLLQHKSYHVYSTKNIERVRQDEAAARAAEEAREQRMQEADAEHRISVLRARAEGRASPPPPREEEEVMAVVIGGSTGDSSKRRDRGDYTVPEDSRQPDKPQRKIEPDLIGADGHINLFGAPPKVAEKNGEHEAERKAREGPVTNGLGRVGDKRRPWYSTLDGEDEGKKKTEWEEKREEKRKDWGDPLAIVRWGVKGVREVEEERREWRRGREMEAGMGAGVLEMLEREKRDKRDVNTVRERKRDRSRSASPDRGHHEKGRHRERHRHNSRSRSRDRSGHHRHHSRKHDSSRRHDNTTTTSHHRPSRSRQAEEKEDTMAKLRRERDEREAAERKKTENMLRKEKEYRTPGWTAADGGRYSSQFGVGEVRRWG
ncbi:uncharacterized protein LAJ45_04671 [Morchella importuna]|uniref:uncharacterized protein n=1 Tax=Morchella importuna TaxID=1174673 RepID=UPI001E8E1F7C|nr:uncharacterized protein LAJ45_04671 [Morchella importuna]KAH8151466.1 hypothetical protein LAJ45_04671 [Morchella importuna]